MNELTDADDPVPGFKSPDSNIDKHQNNTNKQWKKSIKRSTPNQISNPQNLLLKQPDFWKAHRLLVMYARIGVKTEQ